MGDAGVFPEQEPSGEALMVKHLGRLKQSVCRGGEAQRLPPLAANAGIPNMIVFSGSRAGLSDVEGRKEC